MSMISSLIDELNKSADEWNKSNMFELARMCREAADTIWQLRDDLQQANDALRDAEHDESRAWDRVLKAEAENAKLRDENARLRSCLSDDAENARMIMAENAKLRDGYGSMSREHSQTIVELSDAYYSIDQLNAENAKLRELVRCLVYATHPLDRAMLIANAAEMGIEVDE